MTVRNILLLAFSTAVICVTQNVALILTWLFIWGFAGYYSHAMQKRAFLIFFLSFYLFYPAVSTVFGSFHEQAVIQVFIFVAFLLTFRREISSFLYSTLVVRFIFVGWVIWGLLAYAPVFYINVLQKMIFDRIFGAGSVAQDLDFGSSMAKIAFPVIASPVALLLPVLGLRSYEDLQSFKRALLAGTLILCVLSMIRFVLQIDFFPQHYAEIHSHGFRMTGFSMPDPNGFGRMLLLPITFASALVLRRSGERGFFPLLVLGIAILCVLLSFSRTTYLSMFVSLSVLVFAGSQSRRNTALVIAMVALMIVLASFDVLQYFKPGEDRSSFDTLYQRLIFFDLSANIIAHNPLFGAYPGGYTMSMLTLGYEEIFRETSLINVPSTHNMFLQIAVEWGIPMTLLFLSVLVLSLKQSIVLLKSKVKKTDDLQMLVYGSFAFSIALIVHGLTEVIAPSLLFLNLGFVIAAERLSNEMPAQDHEPLLDVIN